MTINLDIHKVADDIDFPVKEWPGKCYQVACALVEAGVVDGEAVYGHWTGPINPRSPVFGDRADLGFTHHGWIVMEDGTVVDPTRWVFEHTKPYIFVGKPSEEESDELWPYDEGGNQLRATLSRPPPRFDQKKERVKLRLPASASSHCLLLLQDKGWTLEQVFWLANLPYDKFGPFVFDVYEAIAACGKEMLIPIDNRRRAEREHVQEKHRGRTKKVSKVRR